MSLTVLSVAYPLTPVGPDAAGGAEQTVACIDAALECMGQRSVVVACEGSLVAGHLEATPSWDGDMNDSVRRWAQAQHRIAIQAALSRYRVDIVHLHGLDWPAYLPSQGPPVLATLHLPPSWYPADVFQLRRRGLHLNCVSQSELRACPAASLPVHVVENGVPVERLSCRFRKRDYVVAMGRICREKGFHIAIDAARRARAPMFLAGEVFRYEAHERYHREEIAPRLDRLRRFLGPVGLARKRRLLGGARCLLAPSLAPETSSLVAMEALACGTPVIAFATGALPEIVEHGRTGFIVHDEQQMADAIRTVRDLDPEECRRAARERFSADRMARDYVRLFEEILRDSRMEDQQEPVAAPARPRA